MGWTFHPPTKNKRVLAPLVLSSLKDLENHLLWLKEFSQTMGSISTSFWLAKIEREVAKDVL
jgi:NADH:ubiquinone oxidoreductase subunit D